MKAIDYTPEPCQGTYSISTNPPETSRETSRRLTKALKDYKILKYVQPVGNGGFSYGVFSTFPNYDGTYSQFTNGLKGRDIPLSEVIEIFAELVMVDNLP